MQAGKNSRHDSEHALRPPQDSADADRDDDEDGDHDHDDDHNDDNVEVVKGDKNNDKKEKDKN